jgi:hypothetical protein
MFEWFLSQNPFWIFLTIPLIISTALFGFLYDERKKAKKRANPHTMSDFEYSEFNHARFRR